MNCAMCGGGPDLEALYFGPSAFAIRRRAGHNRQRRDSCSEDPDSGFFATNVSSCDWAGWTSTFHSIDEGDRR